MLIGALSYTLFYTLPIFSPSSLFHRAMNSGIVVCFGIITVLYLTHAESKSKYLLIKLDNYHQNSSRDGKLAIVIFVKLFI